MLTMQIGNAFTLILAIIAIILGLLGVILATIFQSKQKKKYNDCINLIREKENVTLQMKKGLTKEEINKIDSSIDVDELMRQLYDTYLELENKLNSFDSNLDNTLTGHIKDYYTNKIDIYKLKNISEVTDRIELLNYSITEFSKNKLQFRININCLNYKKANNNIVSGSNYEKVENVILLTYEKINDKWLICNYEKVYERKLNK